MKKIALFALLVSVAHAVTINWQMAISGTDANGNTKLGSYAGIVVLAGHMTSVPASKMPLRSITTQCRLMMGEMF